MNRGELRAFARRYREAEEREAAERAGTLAAGGHEPHMAEGKQSMNTDLRALLAKVDKGKPKAEDLDALRAALAADPAHGVHALSHTALVKELLDTMTASAATREVMAAEVARLREAFGFERSRGVERALVGHVLLCWVRLQVAEVSLTSVTSGRHTLNEGRYRERRLTEAQARFLRAVALLERLRRLGPPVQINIAQQQIVNPPSPTDAARG